MLIFGKSKSFLSPIMYLLAVDVGLLALKKELLALFIGYLRSAEVYLL
ncbi:hypothetical protein [Psychrobacillus psychrodurans]|nr:hypothetical protein [Psychrobacillus psychrodurans]MCZ8540256.1 hypothetical protein [Psychrobacillus psychrodurans]